MWFLYVRKERCLRRAVYQNGVSEELCIKRSRSVSHNGLCPEEYDSITWAVSRGVRLHFMGSVSRKSCTVFGDSANFPSSHNITILQICFLMGQGRWSWVMFVMVEDIHFHLRAD